MSQSSVSQGALPECLKRCVLTKILNYRRKKSARARRTKYPPVFTSASARVSRLSHPHGGSPPGLSQVQRLQVEGLILKVGEDFVQLRFVGSAHRLELTICTCNSCLRSAGGCRLSRRVVLQFVNLY